MNPERVRSRYDVEVQLGAGFFVTVFQAAFDAGIIPSLVPLGPLTFQLGRPTSGVLLLGGPSQLRIGLPASVPGSVPRDVSIDLALALSGPGDCLSLAQTFVSVDAATLMMLPVPARPYVLAALAEILNRSYVLACGLDPIAGALGPGRGEVRVLPVHDGFSQSLGIFFNQKLKVKPPPDPAERRYIRRGNARTARTFLPEGRMFAIGVGEATFPRLAADEWHRRAAKGLSEGRPVLLVDEEDAGHFDSIALVPLADRVRVTTHATYTPSIPDAKVTTEYEVRPILTNGDLTAEVKLVTFDADTGLLGDLLGALGGALAGSLLGGVGAAFGAVGGVIIWETVEEVLETGEEGRAEKEGAPLRTFFDALPRVVGIGLGPGAPTFQSAHSVAFLYGEARVTEHGMAFSGMVAPTPVPDIVPIPLTLAAAVSGTGPDSRFGVDVLIYHDAAGTPVTISAAEAIRLRSEDRLVLAHLLPAAVRRAAGRIVALRFQTGVELTIAAAAGFQQANVISVTGCQLIDPRNGPPYFRDSPDSDPENNLERLSPF